MSPEKPLSGQHSQDQPSNPWREEKQNQQEPLLSEK